MADYTSPYKIPGINLKSNNGDIKLRQPRHLHIRLKEEKEPWSPSQGLTDFAGGLTAVTGGLSLLGDINKMNQGLKQQRSYFQDVFNTTNVTPEEKMGTWKWNNSTGQFTDFPNQKIIPYEEGAANGVNANTIMYPGNQMSKRKYGGSLFLTMAEGGQTPMPQPGMLPKLELGSMSPVQRTLIADNQHYGIPMAKSGGFFTPDKLSAGAENDEYYNKPQDDMMVAKKMAQEYIYKKGTTGESIPDINAPQMAMGGNPFESFGSAGDSFGGNGTQFGQFDNPLTQYYAGLYNPEQHDNLVGQFPDAMKNMYRSIVSPIAANVRAKDQALVEKFQNLDNLEQQKHGGMRKYQTDGAIKAPTATDAAGFENWYNTTMGNLLSSGATLEKINAFITQARQWADDARKYKNIGVDPNQMGYNNLNTNTVQGSAAPGHEAELDKTIAEFESRFETASANGASQAELNAIMAAEDAAIEALNTRFPTVSTNVPADYYGTPGTTPGAGGAGGPGAGGQGQQGSRYSPYVNDVLQAMANGNTRLGPLAFRSRRNLRNLLDREAYAQNALYEDRNGMSGQGANGTLNSAGAQGGWQGGVSMNPGVVPGGGSFDSRNDDTYSSWMQDNNIKRYRSDYDPERGRYTLDVKRYNPNGINLSRFGQGNNQDAQQEDNDPGLFERMRENKLGRQEGRFENKLDRMDRRESRQEDRYNNRINRPQEREENQQEREANRLARQEGRFENKLDRMDNRESRQEDRYNNRQARQQNRDEAPMRRQEERLENRLNREDRRMDKNPNKGDDKLNRRLDRQDKRQERQEYNLENSRPERREARQINRYQEKLESLAERQARKKARIENNNNKTVPPVKTAPPVKPPKDTSNPERAANRAARQARQEGRQTRRQDIRDTRQRNFEELEKLRGFMAGGAYDQDYMYDQDNMYGQGGMYRQGGSYEQGGAYREGGTYYLNGGQIAKLRSLGYDIQEH